MERVVTVNASSDSRRTADEFGIGSIVKADDYGRDFGTPASPGAAVSKTADQGPCLYFGPRGQRCDRRALKGGFCAFHQPGGIVAGIAKPSKKLVASLLAIVAVAWPYLADILREIIRWIHTH